MKITVFKYVCIVTLLTAFLLIIYFFEVFNEKESKSKSNEASQLMDSLAADISSDSEIEPQSKSIIKPKVDVDSANKVAPNLELDSTHTEFQFKGFGPFAPSEALKVQESFKVDPPMWSIGQNWKAERKISNFTMPVSEERDLEIQVERFESIGEEGGEFIGTVIGAPGSTVRLSYRGTAEAGRIDIPSEGRSYQILPGKDGEIIVQDRNPSLEAQAGVVFPPVGIELPPVPEFIPPPPPSGIFDAIPPFMSVP